VVNSFVIRPCCACLFAPTAGRIWRYKVRRTLADAYNVRVVGAREDNIEHVIDHLTKALEYVSMEAGPAAKTDIVLLRKAPLVGAARGWSDVMSGLGSAYGERVKVSSFMV
jgi:hypothetical protein